MDSDAAITPETFNIVHLFLSADWVVKIVLIGLAFASLWSWAVIIDKFARFAALNAQARRFEAAVDSGRALEDIAQQAGEHPRQALPRMLQAALREWREARAKGLLSGGPGRQPGGVPGAAHRPGAGLADRPREPARRGWARQPRHRRHRLAVHRPLRHGLGHHARLPGHRDREEHQPLGGRSRRSPRRCSPPPSAWRPPSRPTSPTTSSPPTPASSPRGWKASPTTSSPPSSGAWPSGAPDRWR